ncbi:MULTISPECIES: hypothetical protein [Rhizobium]|uniref:Uncharacterized protein n=2 Tax=Rhizobium TaxID=379 RepID=K0PST8_9HYPH|nr:MULTISPECIES: hypothetical protein [Rhizobium]KWV59674.1 hypothetical protein AS026_28260 [Rhizobium altiplani]CCM79806.1 hypothetical protein BN77_p40069 [Rhizobium mesoamericanum STM3625]
MDDQDAEMSEAQKRPKRERPVDDLPTQKVGSSNNSRESQELDKITRKLAALNGLSEIGPSTTRMSLEVAIPRSGHENQVEYYPWEYAKEKFGGEINLNRFTKVLSDETGRTQPLPRAYDTIPVTPGISFENQLKEREKTWATWRRDIDGLPSKPSNGKDNWRKLKRDDPAAWRVTPSGLRRAAYQWNNPEKAGEQLPEYIIKFSSRNERGYRRIGLWRDDPLVVRQQTYDLAETFGPENVLIKNEYNEFDSISNINKRGEHEAERRSQRLVGNEIRYNPDLPPVVVQHGDHLVSINDIRDKNLQQAMPVLQRLEEELNYRPEKLRIGMSSREGDSFHNPKLLKELDTELFSQICKDYNLPADKLAKNGKFLEHGLTWVQIENGVFRDGASIMKELSREGKKITDVYDKTQIFTHHHTVDGKIKSSAKMLYASLRDDDGISREVAQIIGVEAREKQAVRRQEVTLNAQKALDRLDGYNSSDDERLSPRKALVQQRQGQQSSYGL